jgi:hypothetical protein
MKLVRRSLFLALTAAALSCGGTVTDPTLPNGEPVQISIAAVTLADDCGTGPRTPPAPETASIQKQPSRKEAGREARSVAYDSEWAGARGDRACEQSSLQLRVENGTGAPATISIRKIEIVDERGTTVGELTAREPSRWMDDAYQPWDEQIGADQIMQVSYALSQPFVHAGESYTVRVTVAAGDDERTVERRTMIEAPASLPPGVVT